jgi:hypothetical protein
MMYLQLLSEHSREWPLVEPVCAPLEKKSKRVENVHKDHWRVSENRRSCGPRTALLKQVAVQISTNELGQDANDCQPAVKDSERYSDRYTKMAVIICFAVNQIAPNAINEPQQSQAGTLG